jgi:hypothetical protein
MQLPGSELVMKGLVMKGYSVEIVHHPLLPLAGTTYVWWVLILMAFERNIFGLVIGLKFATNKR